MTRTHANVFHWTDFSGKNTKIMKIRKTEKLKTHISERSSEYIGQWCLNFREFGVAIRFERQFRRTTFSPELTIDQNIELLQLLIDYLSNKNPF